MLVILTRSFFSIFLFDKEKGRFLRRGGFSYCPLHQVNSFIQVGNLQCNVSHGFGGIDESLPSGLWVSSVAGMDYMSPRVLDQCFEPPRRLQRLNLPSSTLTRYREKHRTTPLPHQTGQNTFKLVGTGHRRSSNISHSTVHPKQQPQYFEACLCQSAEVLDASVLRRHPHTLDQCLEAHLLVRSTLPDPSISRFKVFEPLTAYQN